ncbi:MAG: DarT ssDNA thymidine ADP-ribosyltransferase family protein [Desulfuromonadaceae bacterium]|nr:DarT ssDNA thymidine ADP-ribosyltransferase family protein [Desulfuromonadaceae bacterium]
MTIEEIISRRSISEVLHFTTHLGLVGILDAKKLKSRHRLRDDQRLEHILRLNTPRVLDQGWEEYVNLSISRINKTLFDISSGKWHHDVWWCILSFDPMLLMHPGVYFASTNNAYHQHVLRGTGASSLENLFAPVVSGRFGSRQIRTIADAANFTTCKQAEVLYPVEISTTFLRKIYVSSGEDCDDVCAQIAGTGHQNVDIDISPEKFNGEI